MGGKKSAFYHDDIWNLKYLPKFKWIHLTQQLAYERQERAQKLQVEIRQAKAEMDVYRKNVDKSKMIAAMEAKKKAKQTKKQEKLSHQDLPKIKEEQLSTAKRKREDTSMAMNTASSTDNSGLLEDIRRRFRQRKVVSDMKGMEKKNSQNSSVGRVLGKVTYVFSFRHVLMCIFSVDLLIFFHGVYSIKEVDVYYYTKINSSFFFYFGNGKVEKKIVQPK
jgi:ESF2/ABP1 family protein